MNDGSIMAFLGRTPKKFLILALIGAGVLLLVFGAMSDGGGASQEDAAEGEDVLSYASALEERIVRLCEEVEGVSDVSVLLTLDGGVERVYAENGSGGSYVIISVGGDERVVLVREIYSSVRGIAVVCRGGDNIAVQKKLTELLSCALGVPISKISVAGAGK